MDADTLLKAYNSGLYYWHHPMKHIKWWSPDPRMVLQLPVPSTPGSEGTTPEFYKVLPSRETTTLLRHLQSVFNHQEEMNPRWLPERMFRIFTELDDRGYLHLYSIHRNDELIGGLFGIAIGRIFFGEYIWAPDNQAIQLAVTTLARDLSREGFMLIDMQKPTFRSPDIPCDEISRLSYVDYCKMNAATAGF